MKQFFKQLSALAVSAVLLCGSVTAVGAAQSRVTVRQLSPQCKTECRPDTKCCPHQQKHSSAQGCPQEQCESLCDLLSRCGLSEKQCEELGRLMKQAGDCPGNTAVENKATEAPEMTEAIAEPTEHPAVAPTQIQSEAQSVPPTEAAALAPTEATAPAPAEKPTAPPTEPQTARPTEAQTVRPTEAAEDAYSLSAYEKEVITLVNIIRHENGLGYLGADAQLSRIARLKSQDMRERGYFSHTSPTYGTPFEMLEHFGVSYRTAGENIAMGYRTPQEVVDGWMNSPGHRDNILNKNYTRIGVGYIADGSYWTQLFAG